MDPSRELVGLCRLGAYDFPVLNTSLPPHTHAAHSRTILGRRVRARGRVETFGLPTKQPAAPKAPNDPDFFGPPVRPSIEARAAALIDGFGARGRARTLLCGLASCDRKKCGPVALFEPHVSSL